MKRDMTTKAFCAAIARHGIRTALCGYYDIGHGVSVYAGNGGDTRRAKLAYLLREKDRHDAERDAAR